MTELAVGDILEGRYRIDHPIARGGMSTVYRCVDLRLGRAVAAKLMHDRYASDPASRVRFRREARAMAQLSHPNLVGVYDFSSEEGISFLIMELITGGTLRELLAERGPMPPHAATAVMRAVLTGLSVAHSQGMVHRDIKPDNILINGDHRVKVADFGLVRASTGSSHSTNEIVGTAAYLSPEQVDGSEITPASDVYSAGIVLFELITGTVPFSGDTPLAHAYQRIKQDVPSPGSRIDGVPRLFDELVATATARDPEDRFTDAGEFLAALDDVAAELNLPAYTVPLPTNSAAHRAAEVPTDTTGIIETTTLGQAGSEASDGETSVLGENPPAADETRVLGEQAEAAAPTPPEDETKHFPTAAPAPPPETATLYGQPPVPVPDAPDVDHGEHAAVAKQEDEEPAPAPVTNRSRWKLVLGLILAVILVGAVLVGGWWFGSGRYGEIPQVIGLDRTTAVETISEAGFVPATDIVYDNEVPVDHTVGTQPEEGSQVLPGDTVTVLISQGQPTVPQVPDGMGIEDYRALASERTLEVATGDSVFSPDVPTGAIAETNPPAGTTLPIGATVTAHLSLGPEPISVPDLRGVGEVEARAALEEAGLNVGEVTERFDDSVIGGAVSTTEPGPGSSLERGERVDLVLSTAISVPDVHGMMLSDAETAIEDAGFDVDDERDSELVGSHEDQVVAMDPAPGTLFDPEEDTEIMLSLPGRIYVPSVTGMTVREAREELRDVGLRIDSSGLRSGDTITSQTPAPGEALDRNDRVEVEGED